MATIITSQVGNNYCPQLRLEVNQISETANTATLSWQLVYVAHGYALNANPRTFQATLDGKVIASRVDAISGVTGTKLLQTDNLIVSKTHSAHQVAMSCTAYFTGCSWNGVSMGTRAATGSITVGGMTSYAVKYNANGGSGVPGQQTKWYGETLKLSSTKPTRTGYKFAGWATSASGSVAYQPGANYTANAAVTLYAKWTANTYTVKYNANGGSGAPGQQTKTYGVTLKLSSTKPTRTNYTFKGWGTSASSTTAQYQPGGNYTANAGATLYAVWQLAYTKPRITSLSVDRCNSAGTLTDEGTYARVNFSWSTDRSVSSIKIVCNGVTTNVSASGTSGSVSKVVGANALSGENSYTVTVTVADSGGSTSGVSTVGPTEYILDFKSGGGGMAVGGTSKNDGMEVFWPSIFHDTIRRMQTSYFASARSNGGSTGYYRLVKMTCTGTYANSPLMFLIASRGRVMTTVYINFANSDSSSLGIQSAYILGDADVYRRFPSSNVFELWVKKSESWDAIGLLDIQGDPNYETNKFTFDFTVSFSSSLPSGSSAITSTPIRWARCKTDIVNMLYPVGSIVIRYDHTSPASLYGGTWTRISSRFLYATSASGTIGSTGGSNTHTLTVSQIPSHTHGMRAANSTGSTLGAAVAASGNGTYYGGYIQDIGGGGSHNNAPAFINVSIWRRTA